MWAEEFTDDDRERLVAEGLVLRPSAYSDEPYPITLRLIQDGQDNCLLTGPLPMAVPVRLLQGTDDLDVPPLVALQLLDRMSGPDLRLTLVKDADHRFSTPECLTLLTDTLDQLLRDGARPFAEIEQTQV
jgi:pimeloyl-ACP methyl ester carboxylesterase